MNPILAKIEQDIGAQVQPNDKQAFDNAVEAGKRILFDPSTHQNMELIKNPASRQDPVNTIANGVVGLGYLMYQQSKRTLPAGALIPACVVLICEVYDFSERGLGVTISKEIVARTVQAFMAQMFTKLGVSPDALHQAIIKGQGEIKQHLASKGQPAAPAQPAPAPGGMLAQGGQP